MRKSQVWVAMMLDVNGVEKTIVQHGVPTEQIIEKAQALVAMNQAHFGSVVVESTFNATLMQWKFKRPDGRTEFLQCALVSKASLVDFELNQSDNKN